LETKAIGEVEDGSELIRWEENLIDFEEPNTTGGVGSRPSDYFTLYSSY